MKNDEKLRSKLSKTYCNETKNSGEIYRLYFTKKQVDKILKILKENEKEI